MDAEPTTHYCQRCGEPLTERWPYALCVLCVARPCPHGNDWASCQQCDVESDRAFDEARERRS